MVLKFYLGFSIFFIFIFIFFFSFLRKVENAAQKELDIMRLQWRSIYNGREISGYGIQSSWRIGQCEVMDMKRIAKSEGIPGVKRVSNMN